MIWRYCNKRDSSSEDCGAPAANRNYRKLTDDVLDEIVRDNFRSTYDQDFLGIPQGQLRLISNFYLKIYFSI